MTGANGSETNSFRDMLSTVMQEQGLSQSALAGLLGVSQAGLGRWVRGYAPTNQMRAKVLAKLKTLPGAEPVLAEEPGPIKVAIAGAGMELNMQVSRPTARRVLQVLLSDNE